MKVASRSQWKNYLSGQQALAVAASTGTQLNHDRQYLDSRMEETRDRVGTIRFDENGHRIA